MGGCRCSFRKCHVSTAKFPRMHFFRYPLKEPDRLNKWIQYSQMEEMFQYTETRKKNTVVCARHFRVECFMNYKMTKLAPNAIPTLIRLSKDQALDFELDVEKGVFVTLEKTKLKHLIPPDDFESPLHLENDKILMDMLNELQPLLRAHIVAGEDAEYIETYDENERFLVDKPAKSSSNNIEILETIQLSEPSFKRPSEYNVNNEFVEGFGFKKFKILNSAHYSMAKENKNETTVVLSSRTDHNDIDHLILNDNMEFVECNNVQRQNLDSFSNASSECNDEDLEVLEIHKASNESLNNMETLDSDSNIAELESDTQIFTDSMRQQPVTAQYEILDFKKQNEKIENLQLKISLLEKENSQLKETCEEINELRKKLLHLEMKNNLTTKGIIEQKALQEQISIYSEENKKLRQENNCIVLLKEELLSRVKEIEDLQQMLESFKSVKSNDNELNENKFKEKIISIQKQAEAKENELLAAKSQLIQIEADFNTIKNEKDSLQLKYYDLEQKYLKLQALQNQEATVSTSLENNTVKTKDMAVPTSALSLSKAQLFNAIKRYLSSAMVSLLRMEMFGSLEREWKPDERQVSVDILRLGETVYKYFTDEWRFRLPALRDVRNWLNQSVQMYDEEDL